MDSNNYERELAVEQWRENRIECILTLRQAANDLDTMKKHISRSDLASSVLTGVGSVASAGFVIASFFTAGLSLIPAIIIGSATTGTGIIVEVGEGLFKYIHENKILKQAQDAYQRDYELTVELKENFARIINISQLVIGVEKFGAKGFEYGANVLKHAKLLRVARIGTAVLSFVAVPVDIIDLVLKSIEFHKGSPHEASKQLREMADKMEQELWESDFDE